MSTEKTNAYRVISPTFLQSLKKGGELSELITLVKNPENNLITLILQYYQELGILSQETIQFPDDVEFEKLFVFTTKEAGDWAKQKLCGKNCMDCQGLSECELRFYEWP